MIEPWNSTPLRINNGWVLGETFERAIDTLKRDLAAQPQLGE